MTRASAAGYTLLELIGALVLITAAAAATVPTLTRTTDAARIVDARLEDAAALAAARRALARDVRAATHVAVRPAGLRLEVEGEAVLWSAGPHGLTRGGTPVSRRITGLRARDDGVVHVTLETASRERSLAVAPRTGAAR